MSLLQGDLRPRAHSWADPNDPFLAGEGPPTFSTSRVLAVPPGYCCDINGYYRDLGIPFPYTNASRGDLRKAYLAGGGPGNARKTYVFKQLLDRQIRAEYDATPLGGMFWDVYVAAEIKRRALAEMASRGFSKEDVAALNEVLEGFGVESDDTPDTDSLDNSNGNQDTDPVPAREIAPFPFAFYLWRTTYDNRECLAQWQALLITALAQAGITRQISLDYVGRTPHRFVTARVGARDVVFLNRDLEPDPEVATAIAARMHELQHPHHQITH